ncbi:unnamed protein product [Macrosiphum euphorbiae]|uniref:Uncharacterized protein n=1 Tax=Macrosiphum euphorbiae TaxID=13131 RepID=A0AAV0WXC7_9HEMI|nr:unnamed protein product [Macrosiphum euphorbiae]
MKDEMVGINFLPTLTVQHQQQPLRVTSPRGPHRFFDQALDTRKPGGSTIAFHSPPSANITRTVKTFTTNKERFRKEKKTLYYLLMTLRCPLGRGRLSKFINLQVSGYLFLRTLWPTINHGREFYLASEIGHTL